jgi:hypothetical protein
MGGEGASGPTAQEAGTTKKKKNKKPAPEGTSLGATGPSAQPKPEDKEDADDDPNSLLSLQEQILRVQAHIKTKEKKIAGTKDRIAQQQAALEKAQRLIQEETERLAKHELLKENSTRVLTGLRLRVMAADGAHALVQAAKTFKDLCQNSPTDTADASASAQLVACLRPLSRVWADMCDAELEVPTELDDPKGERAAAAAARAASEAAAAAEAAKAAETASRAQEEVAAEGPSTRGDEFEPLDAEVAGLIAEEAEKVAADNQARHVAEAKAAAAVGPSPPATPTDTGTSEMDAAQGPGTPQAAAMEVDETLRGRPRAPSEEEAEAAPPSTKRLCAGTLAATQVAEATGASSSSAGGAVPKAAAPGPSPLPLPPEKPAGAGKTPAPEAAKVVAKASSRAKSKQ